MKLEKHGCVFDGEQNITWDMQLFFLSENNSTLLFMVLGNEQVAGRPVICSTLSEVKISEGGNEEFSEKSKTSDASLHS